MEGLFIVLVLAVAVGIRVWLHSVDTSRIREAAEKNNWQDVSISWSPFAPGWVFAKGERHYLVSYTDADGNKNQTYCKTSLFTGVFWRDKNID